MKKCKKGVPTEAEKFNYINSLCPEYVATWVLFNHLDLFLKEHEDHFAAWRDAKYEREAQMLVDALQE